MCMWMTRLLGFIIRMDEYIYCIYISYLPSFLNRCYTHELSRFGKLSQSAWLNRFGYTPSSFCHTFCPVLTFQFARNVHRFFPQGAMKLKVIPFTLKSRINRKRGYTPLNFTFATSSFAYSHEHVNTPRNSFHCYRYPSEIHTNPFILSLWLDIPSLTQSWLVICHRQKKSLINTVSRNLLESLLLSNTEFAAGSCHGRHNMPTLPIH